MIILGINASPRKNGNCHLLLKEALRAANDAGYVTETIRLDDLNISPWREKNRKRKIGESPVNDDMKMVEKKIKGADAIVLASPIYFGSLSAQAKIMIDRCQTFWEEETLLKKQIRPNPARGALICVAASDKKDFFKNAKQIAKNFFKIINASYTSDLFCAGLENSKDALKHPEFLKRAYALGRSLCQKKTNSRSR